MEFDDCLLCLIRNEISVVVWEIYWIWHGLYNIESDSVCLVLVEMELYALKKLILICLYFFLNDFLFLNLFNLIINFNFKNIYFYFILFFNSHLHQYI